MRDVGPAVVLLILRRGGGGGNVERAAARGPRAAGTYVCIVSALNCTLLFLNV